MIRPSEEPGSESENYTPFLAGGGQLGALIRAYPWHKTSLGLPAAWPQSLKTAVRILLTSRQPMFIWWGPQLIYLYNDPYRSILGGKHPDALGQSASAVWNEIWDQVGPRVQSAIDTNQGTYDEALFLMMHRNGYLEETYFTFSYSPIPNDEGKTFGIFCANTDETERMISARRLATQRELAARTIDSTTIAETCLNSIAALTSNPRDLPFALLYLREPGEKNFTLMGSTGGSDQHEFEQARFWPLDEATEGQKLILIAVPSGEKVPAGAWEKPPERVALLPIHLAGIAGQAAVLGAGLNPHRPYDDPYEGFLSLITGQIASALTSAGAYEEQRQRAEALEELDRAKTAFFSNISHEFRTPLTLMIGPVEDLLARHDGADHSHDWATLEMIHRNAVRLQKLVNALLDFSRLEAGRMTAHLQPLDLSAFTAELASAFRSAMERARLGYQVECDPLPWMVRVDPEMWEKIVLNLLSNALKYTFEGEVRLRLTLETGEIRLSVADTGTGIPEAELPRLFERFHRVSGARGRTFEGTGIGLALVQELSRLHGGSVRVSSSVGKGSVFTVSLPVQSLAIPDAPPHSESVTHSGQASSYLKEALEWLPDAKATDTPALSGEPATEGFAHILLVDDNADMRSYVARLLSTEYEVSIACNGREALRTASEIKPDLILSDIMMPEMDGFGMLKALRANPLTKSIPVVFLSARAGEEASAEGREAGAEDYIVKPFTARELLARLRGTLLLHRERRRSYEHLSQIFEQSPVAICVLTKPDFVFEFANPFYAQLLGGRAVVGRKIAEVIPSLREDVWNAFHKVVNTGEPFFANEWHIPYDPSGNGSVEDHWFNVAYTPLRNPDQSVRGLISVAHDVTRQVLARKEVERVNRELEEFAYVASHDLQEPLRMVNVYSQMLVRRAEQTPPEQARRYVEFIGTGVRRMEELIRDLLAFARNVQTEAPALQPVSLKDSLEKALDILRVQIEEKHARIEVPALPVVMGDETQMPQLFQNLISNALKYTAPDCVPLIQIECRRSEKLWTVAIRDNGIGFRQEFAEHIFGLFKRLHKDEYEGTGLGLAICKRIVERFGGRIWAESQPGKGSTFSFTLLGEE